MSLKYRLKEVAADFGMTTKEISQIMEKFFEKPKSNTQVLTEEELNVVFDRLTANHQISSLEVVFAVKPAEKKENFFVRAGKGMAKWFRELKSEAKAETAPAAPEAAKQPAAEKPADVKPAPKAEEAKPEIKAEKAEKKKIKGRK